MHLHACKEHMVLIMFTNTKNAHSRNSVPTKKIANFFYLRWWLLPSPFSRPVRALESKVQTTNPWPSLTSEMAASLSKHLRLRLRGGGGGEHCLLPSRASTSHTSSPPPPLLSRPPAAAAPPPPGI